MKKVVKINCTGSPAGSVKGTDIEFEIKFRKKKPAIFIYKKEKMDSGGWVLHALEIVFSKSEDVYFIKQIMNDMELTLENDGKLDIEIVRCDCMPDHYKNYIQKEISCAKLSGSLTTIDFGAGIYVVRNANMHWNQQ